MKTLFEKITESPETLAEFLSVDKKGENKGCSECGNRQECTGKDACKTAWISALNSEA